MALHIIYSSTNPKEYCIDWIISDQDSFGKEIVQKRNIDWPNEVRFADPKIKEV
jgi:hypothetical protein